MGITQALCVFDGKLFATWKGMTGDDRIFYAFYDGTTWSPQTFGGGNTSVGPSLGRVAGKMVMAWKGEHSDERIFALPVTGTQFGPQAAIPGIGSSHGPSLTDFNGRLYAAWKGALEDGWIWWSSSSDGVNWAPQQRIPGVATSTGPSICAFGGRLYAAWKGAENDQAIYYASSDGASWGPQAQIPGVGTSAGPSLATYQGRLYAIWKGIIGDEGLYFSSFDGTSWSPQQNVPGVGSSVGAALAGYGDLLYAMWKGEGGDQTLWLATFDGTRWSGQQRGPGNTGPDAPVNIGMRLQYQETTEWCWLAVAASVANYYDPNSGVNQADLMTSIGHNINKWPATVVCSPDASMLAAHPGLAQKLSDPYSQNAEYCLDSSGIPQVCIKSGGIGDALDVNGHNAGSHATASLAAIAAELGAGRPVCVAIQWPSGGQHVIAIAGVLDDRILVLDPAMGESVIDFEDFPAQYGGGAQLVGYFFTKAR